MFNSILLIIMSLCPPAAAAFGTCVLEELPSCPNLKWKFLCAAGAVLTPICCAILVAYVVVVTC